MTDAIIPQLYEKLYEQMDTNVCEGRFRKRIRDNCSISIICSRKSKLIILHVSRHTTLTSLIRLRRQTNARVKRILSQLAARHGTLRNVCGPNSLTRSGIVDREIICVTCGQVI